ncbi:hypothetical protein C0J52_03952 [Blattella germanica]|nr:hypothetical protein C0J52_03952 [Blattella germanica]
MRITKLLTKFVAVSLLNSFSRALTTAPHLAISNQQLAQANAVKKFKHVHEGCFFHSAKWRRLSITTLHRKKLWSDTF